jgi:hypothetical protein
MFLLSRRQVHAALAGTAAACAYYAAAALGSKRPVKVSGLFLLGSAALAGIMAQGLSSRASVKATVAFNRVDGLINNGGQIGGDLHINGDHYVSGQSHTHLTAPAGASNVQIQGGSGLGVLTGHLDMNSNQMVNVAGVNDPQFWNPPSGSSVVIAGNEIWMNGATIDCGHGKITNCSGVTS